jgi:threonine aldolase
MNLIDLRSDTVTRPSSGMLAAMARAETGDDVYGEDPTVNRLEAMIAERLGKEAALFVPTGTMANQIAIGAQTRPGDEVLCDPLAHVFLWEGGGIARLWGATPRTIAGARGWLDMPALSEAGVRPSDDHYARSRVVCMENTHNRLGGKVVPFETVQAVCRWAADKGLATHLDGARLFNAVVASKVPADAWAAPFDTVSVCFSKGLGSPMGSALVGRKDLIRGEAHRLRKMLGGGMRQVGVVAATAIYALEHGYIEDLAKDHAHASLLADAVEQSPGISLEHGRPESNLVWIKVEARMASGRYFATRLKEKGVAAAVLGDQVVRACTHRDISESQAKTAAEAIRLTAEEVWRMAP